MSMLTTFDQCRTAIAHYIDQDGSGAERDTFWCPRQFYRHNRNPNTAICDLKRGGTDDWAFLSQCEPWVKKQLILEQVVKPGTGKVIQDLTEYGVHISADSDGHAQFWIDELANSESEPLWSASVGSNKQMTIGKGNGPEHEQQLVDQARNEKVRREKVTRQGAGGNGPEYEQQLVDQTRNEKVKREREERERANAKRQRATRQRANEDGAAQARRTVIPSDDKGFWQESGWIIAAVGAIVVFILIALCVCGGVFMYSQPPRGVPIGV